MRTVRLNSKTPHAAAIVDYGLGNLFSVGHACEAASLRAIITSDPKVIANASALILPGVGAFGDAMDAMKRSGMVDAIKNFAASGRPLFGICLGMQLLMDESAEFGCHKGLGIIQGSVVRFPNVARGNGRPFKVPQVGWNTVYPAGAAEAWSRSLLDGIRQKECMYFVHSFYVKPADESVVLTRTRYGDIEFCSGLQRRNVRAFQFHPEKSGVHGLKIYKNFARLCQERVKS